MKGVKVLAVPGITSKQKTFWEVFWDFQAKDFLRVFLRLPSKRLFEKDLFWARPLRVPCSWFLRKTYVDFLTFFFDFLFYFFYFLRRTYVEHAHFESLVVDDGGLFLVLHPVGNTRQDHHGSAHVDFGLKAFGKGVFLLQISKVIRDVWLKNWLAYVKNWKYILWRLSEQKINT